MTDQKRLDPGRYGIKDFSVWFILILCAGALLAAPGICSAAVSRGLLISVKTVVPSLFPFAVLGSLMSGSEPPAVISGLVSRVFGISRRASAAVLTGFISGFPVGALAASSLYREGKIGREEAERMICFTCGPSAAFVVGVIGAGALGSAFAGALIFAVKLISSLAIALFFAAGKRSGRHSGADDVFIGAPERTSVRNTPLIASLSGAVKSAAFAMLTVTAFISLFSLMLAFVSRLTSDAYLLCGAGCFLEIGNGAASLASLHCGRRTLFVIGGALAGWSGLSVHLQVSTLISDTDIRMSKYYASKAAESALTALICLPLSFVI